MRVGILVTLFILGLTTGGCDGLSPAAGATPSAGVANTASATSAATAAATVAVSTAPPPAAAVATVVAPTIPSSPAPPTTAPSALPSPALPTIAPLPPTSAVATTPAVMLTAPAGTRAPAATSPIVGTSVAARATPAPTVSATGAASAATPAPKLILFVRGDALWVASFDGAPPRQVSPDGVYPLPTAFAAALPALVSPDGRWILGTMPDEKQGTWLFSTDGGALRKVDDTRRVMTWAPNSQGYAWADELGVYVKTLAEAARPLTVTRMSSAARVLPLAVAWAPRGDQIAFQVQDGEVVSLRSVSAAGGAARSLAEVRRAPGDYGPDAIQWSPDASTILWQLPDPARLAFVDGTPARELPTDVTSWYGFTPDGNRLVAVWRDGEGYHLGTTDLSGRDRRQVAMAKGDFSYAAVSPNGRQVAYVRFPDSGPGEAEDNELWVVDVDGQNARRLGQDTDLAPFSADWLGPNALLVANGDKPPDISLRRVDTLSGATQMLVRDASWFFAVAPR